MENESQMIERLERAATLLERTLTWLEDRDCTGPGSLERVSATVEASRREEELQEKLASAERELAELKAAAEQVRVAAPAAAPGGTMRKTLAPSTTEMLAKRGIGDGPVDVRALDAALAGLSLEQRIAVKSQLLRAGAIA